MIDFYLPILPSSYLSHSVITTVWIGILVIGFFNLRFGWVLSGLVVPGYLVPLLLIKPLSVGVIVFESIVAYLFVYTISELAANRGLWTNFFGRDRFFALLLTSVGVRLIFDGWALPEISSFAFNNYGINLDYQDSLHSFGLIIVALIANQLWKPGVVTGLFQFIVTLGITYLIVRYFFVEYTNFSLSNIGYLYEDVAGSILASPKSYIILITTAFIASRMNLFYGWDFNGILVPSLLALQWYQPSKIVITFAEAYLILLLAVLVLKLPIFKNITIEGARKIILFFNIGFFSKMALSFAIVYLYPEEKISDYFGFGYLLSTLMAIKMHGKVNWLLFTRTTMQTSLVSIVVATLLGFFLTILPNDYTPTQKLSTFHNFELQKTQDPLILYLEKQKINLYSNTYNKVVKTPSMIEIERFKSALNLIDKGFYLYQQEIQEILKKLHYGLTLVEDRYLVLTQHAPYSGWGIYVVDLETPNQLVIEIPYPLETHDILQSATTIMKYTQAKTMAISGVPQNIQNKALASEFTNYYSLYHTFHKHYAKNGVVQLHHLPTKLYTRLTKSIPKQDESINSLLFVKGYMPKGLYLQKISNQLHKLEIKWSTTKHFSFQKESMTNGFAELYLSDYDRIKLISSYPYHQRYALKQEASPDTISGLLQTWLLDKKIEIAPKLSEQYKQPNIQTLRFFDHVILTPIMELLDKYRDTFDSQKIQEELKGVVLAAKSIGYTLTLYRDITKDQKYIILHEDNAVDKKYWGTYVFGFGNKENIMIQVPRPYYEPRTFEYSIELFGQLNAKALLISGAHPLANSDRSSDVMLYQNKTNLFNLTNQILYRHSGIYSMNALQIRAISQNQELVETKAVLALNENIDNLDQLNPTQSKIYHYLRSNMPLSLNDGNAYSAGYDANALQSLYLQQSLNDTFNTLWLPYNILGHYRQRHESDMALAIFRVLNIEITTNSITSLYRDYKISHTPLEPHIIQSLKYYLATKDIAEIEKLEEDQKINLKMIIDTKNKQPYLILLNSSRDKLLSIVKLNAQPPYTFTKRENKQTLQEQLKQFYLSNATFLKVDNK